MPSALHRGGYVARFATGASDLAAAQALRHRCFVEDAGRPVRVSGLESDQFDALCEHVLVEDTAGKLVCCFRVLAMESGAEINMSYSAQYYDLEIFFKYSTAMVELGRFCVADGMNAPDVLRIAWGMLAAFVDAHGAGLLFGCSSFEGTDPMPYDQAFDVLAERHLGALDRRAGVKSDAVVRFADTASAVVDRRSALAQMPSLLKTYLGMGGWVSDHAVIDREMNTLHVFTALEIAAIPPARAKALRMIGARD